MRKTVIFDLDGTLLDTLGDLAFCTNTLLVKYGFPAHPADAYRYFVGDGLDNQLRRALPEGTDEAVRLRIRAEYMPLYRDNCMNLTKPYDGIETLLARLKADGYTLAVCSNKPDARTREMIAHYFPGVFDVVIGHREGAPVKPDPGIVLEILEKAQADEKTAFYVGDTATDVRTAKNARLSCAGVLWGFRGRGELETAGADVICEDPEALYDAISDFYKE